MKPFVMLMTGISGSGKSTVAKELAIELKEKNIAVEIVDGDDTRKMTNGVFGYGKEDRIKMSYVNQTIGEYLRKNGINVIYTLVCPYENIRKRFRDFFGDSYVEVFVSASPETCAERDPKGLYKLSREDKLKNLNGTNDVFEIPENPDIVIDTENINVDEAKRMVIDYLCRSDYIS